MWLWCVWCVFLLNVIEGNKNTLKVEHFIITIYQCVLVGLKAYWSLSDKM